MFSFRFSFAFNITPNAQKLVANMVTKGFNVARIKAMEFEELVPFLKSKELVGVVKKALQRLHQTSVLLGAEVVENDETVVGSLF